MTDVEELLRETLSDPRRKVEPGPGMYETVRARTRDLRRRRSTIGVASLAVVAIAIVGSVLGVQHTDHHTATATLGKTSPPASPAHGTLGTAIDIGNSLTVVDAVTTTDGLYVLAADPNKVVLLSPEGAEVKATAAGPTGAPSGVVVGGGRVWAWSQNSHDVRVYDSKTLSFIAEFTVQEAIFNVVAIDNELYFTTDQGLKVAHADVQSNGVTTNVGSITLTGSTYGLAADPTRHRLLVGVMASGSPPTSGFVGMQVVAIDTRTGKVVAHSSPTALGKESIAVVGDQVWVGGYGDVDKPRLLHLDAKTLKILGTSPIGAQVGPGSIVWPGTNVVWARGGGDEQLGCLDPKTGAVLETWSAVQGPVTSVGGTAFGVENGLQPLTLAGGCTG